MKLKLKNSLIISKNRRNNDENRFRSINSSVRAIREERGKEALICLKLSGHKPSKGCVLDLGCGPGYITHYFLRKGIHTIGLDLSKNVLSKAKINNTKVDLILASGLKLPFRNNVFYTVILNDVLEHVSYKNAKYILKQIMKGMEPNGKLYISVANKYQIREPHTHLFFITWLPRRIYNPVIRKLCHGNQIYPYTKKRLIKLCKETGIIFEDYTWFYASKKLHKLNYVRDIITRGFIKFLKKIMLQNHLLLNITKKFSVILFICR